ncbi:MAG: homoserine kinase [Firmicutes bacterium]|nr:homoserine kinase [Bacillota bacterium]
MISVKVPATSANIGPGFDSIGIALNLYNIISAQETDEPLKIDILDDTKRFLPHDKKNLVYRAITAVFKEAGHTERGLHIIQHNEIPVTRGLGSSSASIVGGVIAANEICKAKMSKNDMISFASQLEGHPDNATPAMVGGFTAAVIKDNKTYWQKAEISPQKIKFGVFIPNFILKTKKARKVLPPVVPHADAVFNASRAALLTAAMITENYDNLIPALDDRLHEQYRKRFIEGVDEIFELSANLGAYGSYISGAGPAVIAVISADYEQAFTAGAEDAISKKFARWKFSMLCADNCGAKIIE